MRSSNTQSTNFRVTSVTAKDVDVLVLEVRENLRLSPSLKAVTCSQLSRKSSRASPYYVPGKTCICDSKNTSPRKPKGQSVQEYEEDPYELLQKLLKEGELVNEAVRRVQLGVRAKSHNFYESDEGATPISRVYPQEN